MSKIHYFQRYSSAENTVTNNTLQLLARIYNYSPSQAAKLLSELTGEPIEIGIEINQQERAGESVPDGTILQRSFKVLVESKVDSKVNAGQLLRHAGAFRKERQKILLLLTKEKISKREEDSILGKLSVECPKVVFKNITYEDICNVIGGLFREYEDEMQELVSDYIEYCNDTKLFNQAKFLLRVVPCRESLKLNLKHAMYFQPSDRGYTQHAYVGIYNEKRVKALLEIDSVFDATYCNGKLTLKLVRGRHTSDYDSKIISMIKEANKECGYELGEGHRFFCATEAVPTNFIKSSYGGVMSTRLLNLKDIVGEFNDVKDLAHKLEGKKWE